MADTLAADAPLIPADQAPAAAQLARAQATTVNERATRLRTAALMAATAGGTLAYGRAKWWQDGFGGGFKTARSQASASSIRLVTGHRQHQIERFERDGRTRPFSVCCARNRASAPSSMPFTAPE